VVRSDPPAGCEVRVQGRATRTMQDTSVVGLCAPLNWLVLHQGGDATNPPALSRKG
jgi:hypothetical protein